MCTFLVVVQSPVGKPERVVSVFGRHDIGLQLIDGYANSDQFEPGTRFFGTSGPCDCGTPIGRCGGRWSPFEVEVERELQRWLDALIDGVVKSKSDWLGVYHSYVRGWHDTYQFELKHQTVETPDELTLVKLSCLREQTVLRIEHHIAASLLRLTG